MSQFFNKYSAKNFANANIFDNSPAVVGATAEKAATAAAATPPVQGTTTTGSSGGESKTNIADRSVAEAGNSEQQQQQRNNSDAQAQKQEEELHPDHLLKHPLQNTWTLWYLENDRSKAWEDMQNEITSFDTVEDFWSLYNHIKQPSEIKIGSDYSMFKQGIRPMWEDAANKQGGRWVINLNKSSKSDLDNLWLDVLLCLIGEAFDHSDEICGAVVNIRPKMNKISIWTANGNNQEAALEIGQKLRETLRLQRSNLQYQLHKDSMVKQGSSVKSIYNL